MSYCLKTGGLIYDEAHDHAFSSDLHIVGDCVVAVTVGEPQYVDRDNQSITLVIKENAQPYHRIDLQPYGIIVVPVKDCIATPRMEKHIRDYYSTRPNFEVWK